MDSLPDNHPSLYLHVPFCVRKCEFCDFESAAAPDRDIDEYLTALDAEFALRFSNGIAPPTVFIGGGTPTRLTAKHLRVLRDILARHCDLTDCREFSIEINPSTLTPEKAAILREIGVDRASFGVQSFDPDTLQKLGRAYESGLAEPAIAMARAVGIERISMDMIFGIPGQTSSELLRDLKTALSFDTEHLSLYALMYEDDTPLTHKMRSGEIQPISEELELEMFRVVDWETRSHDMRRYEVSNFARKDAECLHNIVYWQSGDWVGVGPAAHGHVAGDVTLAHDDWRKWAADIARGELPFKERYQMSPEQRAETVLLMGLRLTDGVPVAQLEALLARDFDEVFGAAVETLVADGLLVRTPTHIHVSERGMELLDSMILKLVEPLGVGA